MEEIGWIYRFEEKCVGRGKSKCKKFVFDLIVLVWLIGRFRINLLKFEKCCLMDKEEEEWGSNEISVEFL